MLGTVQYSAPEYLLGDDPHSPRRDLRMLTYGPVRDHDPQIPVWIEGALRKAVHPDPRHRYEEVAEFAYDLRHPNREFLSRRSPPLIERNPVAFWKGVAFLLALALVLAISQTPKARHAEPERRKIGI